MKIVVLGLGNFGMSLAVHLADTGNEVVAADRSMERIDMIKDRVSHAVALDVTNEKAYNALPLKGTNLVVVGIGSEEGTGIMTTAVVKRMCDPSTKIIARSSSPIQDTIFEAMGVDQIIHPEGEYAERMTKKINLKGSIANFELDDDYLISEVQVCESLIGKTLIGSKFRELYDLNIITIMRKKAYNTLIGRKTDKQIVIGMPRPDTEFKENDVLVVFGKNTSIDKYLKITHGDDSD